MLNFKSISYTEQKLAYIHYNIGGIRSYVLMHSITFPFYLLMVSKGINVTISLYNLHTYARRGFNHTYKGSKYVKHSYLLISLWKEKKGRSRTGTCNGVVSCMFSSQYDYL